MTFILFFGWAFYGTLYFLCAFLVYRILWRGLPNTDATRLGRDFWILGAFLLGIVFIKSVIAHPRISQGPDLMSIFLGISSLIISFGFGKQKRWSVNYAFAFLAIFLLQHIIFLLDKSRFFKIDKTDKIDTLVFLFIIFPLSVVTYYFVRTLSVKKEFEIMNRS